MKKLCMLAVLVSSVSVAYSDVYFQENFDGYADVVGTGDRSVLTDQGWEFVATNGAITNNFTEVTVEWNIEVGENGLNPKINNGNRAGLNPVDERGEPTSGIFLFTDSDAFDGTWNDPRTGVDIAAEGQNLTLGSGQSYDAITPAIDCSGANQVWLHFDSATCLNNNGSACFVVDVKVGEGDWVTKLFRAAPARFPDKDYRGVQITENFTTADYDFPTEGIYGKEGNQGGTYGPVHLNLSDVAAGQNNVRIRFRHYEGDWDWWMAVDNIVVDNVAPPMGDEVAFGPVDFENGIPTDWVASTDNVIHSWFDSVLYYNEIDALMNTEPVMTYKDGEGLNFLTGQGYAIYFPFGGTEIAEDGTVDPSIVGTLDTPAIDCSAYRQVAFYCWSEFNPGDLAKINYFIEVSVDGGTTFATLFDFNKGLLETGEGSRVQEHFISVPEAAGQSAVIFRFKGVGADGERFFAIDDVKVTGSTSTNVPNWSLF